MTTPVDVAADNVVDDTADEPQFELTDDARASLKRASLARWQGWLAPMDQKAGDRRSVPLPSSGQLKTREMPLPLFWQRETSHGGQIINGAVEVGSVVYADLRPREDRDGQIWMWGTGFINLSDDEGVRFAGRLDDGMSRWVSVKLDFDPDFEPPSGSGPAEDEQASQRPASPTDHPDWWRLMNVTAEPQPAFDGATIELIDELDDPGDGEAPMVVAADGSVFLPAPRPAPEMSPSHGAEVTAMSATVSTSMSVPPLSTEIKPPEVSTGPASGGSGPASTGGSAGDHGSGDSMVAVVTGDTSLPIADRDVKWNGSEASTRLVEWAGGRFSLDPKKMAKVFLYRDTEASAKFVGAYKFPIADVIGGKVQIVPAAVFQSAAILKGARGGTKIPKADQNAMRAKLNTIYTRMREQFKDDKIRSPFEAAVHDAHVESMRDGDSAPGKNVPPWRKRPARRGRPPGGVMTASATSWAAAVAARVPDEPPAEWFTQPKLSRATKVRITDEGRVFGHVAGWTTDHAAFPGVKPPRNRDQSYSKFHRHPVRTADGGSVKTGPLATGGHTSTDASLAIETVQAHYDDPRYVVADVVAGEDEFGIWVSGALRPGVSPFQIMLLDRYSISGDWRYGELLAACSVSVPGFHLDADDEVVSLTAAASAAGVESIPVVAEAVPEEITSDTGSPLVLIAAGVIVDEPTTDDTGDAFTAAIDGLGEWLAGQLTALRVEFGMTEAATTPSMTRVIEQFQAIVTKELDELREEFGLPAEETPAADTVAGDTATAPEAVTPDLADGAAATETSPDAGTQPEVQQASAEPALAEFTTWIRGKFDELRRQHAAATAATPAADDSAAELSSLAASVHGDELAELAAAVHTSEVR